MHSAFSIINTWTISHWLCTYMWTTVKVTSVKQSGHGTIISRPIWKSQIFSKEGYQQEMLWCSESPLPRNRYTRVSLWSQTTTGKDGMNCIVRWYIWNEMFRVRSFASKSISSTERWYNNIERETLGIIHGLKNFHHYVSWEKPDHKPLVMLLNKDVTMLLQWLQCILLKIYQHKICTLCKLVLT